MANVILGLMFEGLFVPTSASGYCQFVRANPLGETVASHWGDAMPLTKGDSVHLGLHGQCTHFESQLGLSLPGGFLRNLL